MRRTNNMMTLIALLILVVIIGVGSRIFKAMVESSVPDGQTEKLELSVNTESVDSASGGNVEAKEAETAEAQEEISLEDALFIGDSRTVKFKRKEEIFMEKIWKDIPHARSQ